MYIYMSRGQYARSFACNNFERRGPLDYCFFVIRWPGNMAVKLRSLDKGRENCQFEYKRWGNEKNNKSFLSRLRRYIGTRVNEWKFENEE